MSVSLCGHSAGLEVDHRYALGLDQQAVDGAGDHPPVGQGRRERRLAERIRHRTTARKLRRTALRRPGRRFRRARRRRPRPPTASSQRSAEPWRSSGSTGARRSSSWWISDSAPGGRAHGFARRRGGFVVHRNGRRRQRPRRALLRGAGERAQSGTVIDGTSTAARLAAARTGATEPKGEACPPCYFNRLAPRPFPAPARRSRCQLLGGRGSDPSFFALGSTPLTISRSAARVSAT